MTGNNSPPTGHPNGGILVTMSLTSVIRKPLRFGWLAKAFLKNSRPYFGTCKQKAVTGMSGLNGLTARFAHCHNFESVVHTIGFRLVCRLRRHRRPYGLAEVCHRRNQAFQLIATRTKPEVRHCGRRNLPLSLSLVFTDQLVVVAPAAQAIQVRKICDDQNKCLIHTLAGSSSSEVPDLFSLTFAMYDWQQFTTNWPSKWRNFGNNVIDVGDSQAPEIWLVSKSILKILVPTLGLANKKAVTGMSGLNGLTASSSGEKNVLTFDLGDDNVSLLTIEEGIYELQPEERADFRSGQR
nr:hypothetical protein Iba_chr14aCG3680 [Ipomoea batatas]